MFKLGRIAKTIMAVLATGSATGLGFLPHTDPWFNILTGVLAVAGVYGVYAVPNKQVEADADKLADKLLPANVAGVVKDVVNSALDALLPAVTAPAEAESEPAAAPVIHINSNATSADVQKIAAAFTFGKVNAVDTDPKPVQMSEPAPTPIPAVVPTVPEGVNVPTTEEV